MKPKCVVMFTCTDSQKEQLYNAAKGYDMDVVFLQDIKLEQNKKEMLRQASMILGEPDMEDILANPKLEWVQMTWAGTDIYTTQRALNYVQEDGASGFPKQVRLTNMSGAFGVIMSEYAIGAILSCYRRFPTYLQQQQQTVWKDAGSEESLWGKTALLLGTGDIGTQVAVRLQAFGTKTIGLRRNTSVCPQGFTQVDSLDALEQWLPKADLVICSLPNKPNTRHLLTKERLQSMKKEAVLLNMGRGTLLDCDELNEVLEEGHLKGVILDVTNPEPLPKKHPLWQQQRVMITPHIAGPSIGHCADTQDRIVAACVENLKRYMAGEPLLHEITDEDFEYSRK